MHSYPLLAKQMILTAFPPLSFDKDITPENFEGYALRQRRLIDQYSKVTEKKKYSWKSIVGTGFKPTVYG